MNLLTKNKVLVGLIAAALLLPAFALAARTSVEWVQQSGTSYIQPNFGINGVDLLIYGSNHYINFGTVTGVNGYGIRDNAGTIECKNSAGAWGSCGSGGGGGASGLATSSLVATWPIVVTPSASAVTFSFTGLSTTTNSGMTAGNLYVGSGGIFQTSASSSIFGYTPLNPTRNLTVAGTANQVTSSAGAQDLSADRTWTLSLPNHVIFPGNFQVTNSTTTNATTTGSTYLTGVTASRGLYVDSTGKVGPLGSGVSGNCVQWTANNTLGDAGAVCGTGGGGVTAVAATFPLSVTGSTGSVTFSSLFSTTTNTGMSQGNLYIGSGGIMQTSASSSIFGYTPEQPLTFSLPLTRSGNAVSTLFGTTSTWGLGNNGFVITGPTGIPFIAASSTLSLPNTALQNSTISGIALGASLNNLTINNAGSGVASGGTYNGSSAITLSYNSIGAVPTTRNINTTYPLSGGGALSGDLTLVNNFSTTSNSGMAQGNLYVGSGGVFQTGASSTLFGYTPLNPTRNITVAGTANQITSSAGAQDLSADRTWTFSLPSLVIFPGQASTTQFSSGRLTIGLTASTTIDGTGNIVVPSGSNLTVTGKTDGCATWATGVLNSTGSACGGAGSSPGLPLNAFQYNNATAFGGVSNFIYNSANGFSSVGGSSTPQLALFSVVASSTGQQITNIFAVASSSSSGTTTLLSVSPPSAGADIFDVLSTAGASFLTLGSTGSTTIGAGTPITGVTINGGATTTGSSIHFGDVLPATSGGANLGSATFPWGSLFMKTAGVLNFGNGNVTLTHSTGALSLSIGTLFNMSNASTSLLSVFNKAYFGGTATTTIDSTGNIVIPSGSNLTVTGKSDGCATWATGVLNSTGSACGSGGGSSAQGSTTAQFVIYPSDQTSNPSTYYLYNASSTVVTSGAFQTLFAQAISSLGGGGAYSGTPKGTGPGGGIYITPGTFYTSATTTINGSDQASTLNGPGIQVWGAAQDATKIVVTNNATFLAFDHVAIPTVHDMSIYVNGGGRALVATSSNPNTRSIFQFDFHNLSLNATSSSSVAPINMGNILRGQFANIEFFGTHGCAVFYSEGNFNPGDFTWTRTFCETDSTAGAIALNFASSTNATGYVNQVHFVQFDSIANGTGDTYVKGNPLLWSTFDEMGVEQYDKFFDGGTGFDVVGNTFIFKYITPRNAAGLTLFSLPAGTGGNSFSFGDDNNPQSITVVNDANGNSANPNYISGYIGQDAGTASVTDTGGTLVIRDIRGYGAMDTKLQPDGHAGVFTFLGTLLAKGTLAIADFTLAILRLPYSAAPTISTNGDTGIDSTANQLQFESGGTQHALVDFHIMRVAMASSTWGAGTTTLFMGPTVAPIHWVSAVCETSAGTLQVSLYDGTNRSNFLNASTTKNTNTLSTNVAYTAGTSVRVDIGTAASSPTNLGCSFKYTYDIQ